VRILVTNDDGVRAPGIAALVRALAGWVERAGDEHELIVVAPLENHSGASSAVGTVYERSAIDYERVQIEGAEHVPAYGLDASPALSVIVSMFGGFGSRPDVIVSGINLGANIGRSVLHSGTVGAVLTGGQMGARGLAVSLRVGPEPHPWETPSTTALAVLPALLAAPPATMLNLNLPAVALAELRGIRRGSISGAGLIKGADHQPALDPSPEAGLGVHGGPFDGRSTGGRAEHGTVRLELGSAVPALPDSPAVEPESDAALVAAGFASLTPLSGVGDDPSPGAASAVDAAIAQARLLLAR
jgi:5'-nucleotidase